MSFNLIEHIRGNDENIVVWLFNIGTEKYWSNGDYTVTDTKQEIAVNHCEEMNLLIARSQDYLILRNTCDREYYNDITAFTGCTPHILIPDYEDEGRSISEIVLNSPALLRRLKEINKDKNVIFVPYGVSYLEEKIAQICDFELIGAPSKLNSRLNSKIFSREVAEQLGCKVTEGVVCTSIDELREAYAVLSAKYDAVIVKQPDGASGKGLYIVKNQRKLETVLIILKRYAKKQTDPRWIIEGWISQKQDLNYQVYVNEAGEAEMFSVKTQITDETVYTGSVIPADISEEIQQQCAECGIKIGTKLAEIGFHGVLGIDALIDEKGELVPIIEINARFTLSTYLSFLPVGNMKVRSFYEKIIFDQETEINYSRIKKHFLDVGIPLSDGKTEGIIIYVSATVDSNIMQGIGRFFCLAVAPTYSRADKLLQLVTDEIRKINTIFSEES